jgi:hypothetical protein
MTISVISACKNRVDALSISVSSWILFDEIDEIVIVDWNSDKSAKYLTELSNKIKVITVPNEQYFNQPQPLNLAAKISTGNNILKLDADTILNPYYNFFDHYKVDETNFVTGIYKQNINFVHQPNASAKKPHRCLEPIWGTLYLTRENYFKIGGYNENMDEYVAWEDNEIVARLVLLGLEHTRIEHHLNTIMSIPHGYKERIENFKAYNEKKSLEILVRKKFKEKYSLDEGDNTIDKNIHKILLEKHNRINCDLYKPKQKDAFYVKPVIEWDIEQVGSQHYIAQKILNK